MSRIKQNGSLYPEPPDGTTIVLKLDPKYNEDPYTLVTRRGCEHQERRWYYIPDPDDYAVTWQDILDLDMDRPRVPHHIGSELPRKDTRDHDTCRKNSDNQCIGMHCETCGTPTSGIAICPCNTQDTP